MKYKYLRLIIVGLALCWLLPLRVNSRPVSLKEARIAAETFISMRYPATGTMAINTTSAMGVSALAVSDIQPWNAGRSDSMLAYVVDLEPSGYIVMRLDDELSPVKLYSNSGAFTNLPPAFLDVMKYELAGELAVLVKQQQGFNASQVSEFKTKWNNLLSPSALSIESVGGNNTLALPGPLLTTTWNQDSPYNYYAPAASGGPDGKAYAGCVATAVSQILRFHEMPVAISGNYTYSDNAGNCQGTYSASDVGLGDYDWLNMPNAIFSSSPIAQQRAVAKLIYHCAVTVRMNFEADGSGAYSALVTNALQTSFEYITSDLKFRSDFSDADWYNKISDDIAGNRPIYYAFASNANGSGGHAVVCDGAQNGNELHINFGWGGYDNAWYNMDNLNGYNYYHEAIFGIEPNFFITTETMPDGVELEPYSKQMEATNGIAPYTWSIPDRYYEKFESNTFDNVGVAQGWSADDGVWQLDLPFGFPFFGQQYSNCWVDSNGKINFGISNSNYVATETGLVASAAIAVLWDDLRTDNGYDIYVESTATSIMIRWHARYFNEGAPVNIAATLYKDGAIRLSYGNGDIIGGVIGISSGDGTRYLISGKSESGSMGNYDDILIRYGGVFPSGLELSADGLVSGVPTKAGTNLVTFMAEDINGIRATKTLTLVVKENSNQRPVIDYAVPSSGSFAVPEKSDKMFRVVAYDPEGSNLVYQWIWDGIDVGEVNASCLITNTGVVGTRNLKCYVSDGFWTNQVFTQWDVVVVQDSDYDSIPDDWELNWGTNLVTLKRDGDYDGDGLLDGEERIAGTSPTNKSSVLALIELSGGTFEWQTVTGRLYTVYAKPDMMLSWSNTGYIVEGDGSQQSYSNNMFGVERGFLKVGVELK